MQQTDNIELYTYALSPFGMKVYWTLIYKRVKFDLIYVTPRTLEEIAFTSQKTVPVLKINDEWRLDSGPLCEWLDEHFPGRPVAGGTRQEQDKIREADNWVTNNIIALDFRRTIDPETRNIAFHNGRKLAKIMRHTSGGVPWHAQFFWAKLLRGRKFIQRAAAMTDQAKSVAELEREVVAKFEKKIEPTGFLAGTDSPSYADIAAFAQSAAGLDLSLRGTLNPKASSPLANWFRTIAKAMPEHIDPPLIRGRRPADSRLI